MKTISILNLKGGVAKTFTAANMAYELYRRGYKVLLIDNDKQGNLSKAYSRYDAENVAPATRLLAGDWENADELIQHTEYEGIDIVTEQIEDAKAFNQTLKLAGVLITSYQNTDGEAAGVEWLEQKTDFNILGIIRYSKKVAENTFMRKPIYEYSPCCGAAQGYKKFVTAYTGKAR